MSTDLVLIGCMSGSQLLFISIFKVIHKDTALVRMLPTVDLSGEENVARR